MSNSTPDIEIPDAVVKACESILPPGRRLLEQNERRDAVRKVIRQAVEMGVSDSRSEPPDALELVRLIADQLKRDPVALRDVFVPLARERLSVLTSKAGSRSDTEVEEYRFWIAVIHAR